MHHPLKQGLRLLVSLQIYYFLVGIKQIAPESSIFISQLNLGLSQDVLLYA